MKFRALESPGPKARTGRAAVAAWCALALVAALLAPGAAGAAPFVWDDNDDHVDDRIESVHAFGFHLAFENADTTLRQRIAAVRLPLGQVLYSVYVIYDHDPTPADYVALSGLAMPVLQRYRAVPAVKSFATWLQVQQAVALAGVERVEAVPLLYPVDRAGAASIGVRDPSHTVFPTAADVGAPAGEGVVVAILDTGINDAPDGSYPGHEGLVGRCLGGAEFFGGDSSLDTPRAGSFNPVDRGGEATRSHGTHVAGIVLGAAGATGYAPGVAPAAMFVDVKALGDAGLGTGIPEAIDWCIGNRARAWGADPAYHGIDVINLSLGSLDLSDGNDLGSRLAKRAVDFGIVVVASTGNEGETGHIPSPAAGDLVLAVGALDDQRTPLNGDDLYPSFNDPGPRVSDGDLDAHDEQKPDLLAPGVAVLSADGDLGSDGAQYRRLTGTSMSAAYVSGVVAVLRSALPSATPGELTELLRSTGLRTLATPPSTGGPDPRWRSTTGFGAVDLYAAWLEVQQPARTQVRRLTLSSTPTDVTAVLWTQRELGTAHLVFERANDLGGVPGVFVAVDSVAASGDGSLVDEDDLQAYGRTWPLPPGERGATFWYRAAYTEGGVRHASPALRATLSAGPSVATIEVTIVHNAYDADVQAVVHAGPPGGASFALPGTSAAVASDWVTGTSLTGNVSWTFRVEVPAGVADAFLPPSAAKPWWIQVEEGGFLNRSGRLQEFELTHHAPGGDVVYVGGPTPQQTFEGSHVQASIPQGLLAAEPSAAPAWRIGPNPVAPGGAVELASRARVDGALRVYDVVGREVGRAPFRPSGEGSSARWEARDAAGRPLPAGLYFARAGERPVARLVVVAR